LTAEAAEPAGGRRRRHPLLSSTAIILYSLVLGVLAGHLFPMEQAPLAHDIFKFMSKAFINLIKMLVVPLILATIVLGIGKTGDIKTVGRMGVKALIYFRSPPPSRSSSLAFANIVRPGDGLAPNMGEVLAKPKTFMDALHLFPRTSWTRWPGRTSCRSSCSRRSSAWPPPTWARRPTPS
jgi:Na+/H+-dicarboxylate symporter